jgi:hypothetical protein
VRGVQVSICARWLTRTSKHDYDKAKVMASDAVQSQAYLYPIKVCLRDIKPP